VSNVQNQEPERLTESDLAGFIGGGVLYRHPLLNIQYTEGVQYMAQKAGAYWLIEAIAFWQKSPAVKDDPMLQEIQFWKLIVREDHSATLICERDSGNVAVTQEIPFTDFPLANFQLYCQGGILLLPSEY
jgi:hypothetical protein